MSKFMESARLTYRTVELDDVDVLVEWINDFETRRFLDHRVWPMGKEAERAWVEGLSKDAGGARQNVVFVACDKADGLPVACSGFHEINWVGRKAEWGIVVAPGRRGRGFGREVAEQLIWYAFTELNLERVGLEVCAKHAAGIACYDAVGFVREGLLRKAFWSRGVHEDTVVMSILREDWRRTTSG